MRRLGTILLVLGIAAAGCGGDDDSNDDDTNTGGSGANNEAVGGDPDFSLSDLPDDFPAELVPPQWDTGVYSEALGFPTASFESSMAFQEAIDFYNGIHGEGLVVGNDPGERLAQWTRTPPWVVSVFEGSPLIIGFSKVED